MLETRKIALIVALVPHQNSYLVSQMPIACESKQQQTGFKVRFVPPLFPPSPALPFSR